MTVNHRPHIEIFPQKSRAPMESASELDFLIRITAPDIEVETQRPPLNLGLVLDRSGSMSGRKLQKAKEAAEFCVDQLKSRDRISLTVFDDRVDVVVPSTTGDHRTTIKERIRSVRSGGTTALHSAWVKGGKQVAEFLDPDSMNRVLLLTDGLANVGETNGDVIVTQAKSLNGKGVSTTTIGVGGDFNEDLLIPMAKAGGGNSWFVEGPEDFLRIFENELSGLVRESCLNVRLELQPHPGVVIIDLLNDFDRSADREYDLPNLMAGEPLDVVVRVKLPSCPIGEQAVFDVILSWDSRDADQRDSGVRQARILYAPEEDVQALEADPVVEKAVRLLSSARDQRKAMERMDRGDFEGASRILQEASAPMMAMAKSTGDMELLEEAKELNVLSDELSDRDKRVMSRKKMAYSSTGKQRGRKDK